MVNIPFLNIEVAEPRVLELIPDVTITLIQICSRLVDLAIAAVFPLDERGQIAVTEATIDALPREFDRVIKRELEGKIKNDEQLSSELEDASYDYYRRMLRTSIAGGSDELHEDVIKTKLFGEELPRRQLVWERHQERHPEMFVDTEEALQDIAADISPEQVVQTKQGIDALRMVGAQRAAVVQQQLADLEQLRLKPKTRGGQARVNVRNSAIGIGLGLLMFRGSVIAFKHIVKEIKKMKKQAAAGGRQYGQSQRQRSDSQTPATTQRTARAAAAQEPKQAGAKTPATSKQPTSSSDAGKQATQQTQEQASPAAARRSRPSTRTR